jgi:hypothetical protein
VQNFGSAYDRCGSIIRKTWRDHEISALPSVSGIQSRRVKRSAWCLPAPQRSPCLFDYLIGAGEQRGRHSKAKRPGGGEIDHQLDHGRLLDWQVRWLLAFQDATGIDAAWRYESVILPPYS